MSRWLRELHAQKAAPTRCLFRRIRFVALCCQAGQRQMPAMVDLLRLDVHLAHFLVAKISSRVELLLFSRRAVTLRLVAYFYATFTLWRSLLSSNE